MAQRFYSRPESEAKPGRVLMAYLTDLGPGDLLTVPDLGHFGDSEAVRDAALLTLIRKDIRLKVLNVPDKHRSLIAKFQTDVRRAKIDRAKARGAYADCGRPATVDREAVRKLKADGLRPEAIAGRLGISRSTAYRILSAA